MNRKRLTVILMAAGMIAAAVPAGAQPAEVLHLHRRIIEVRQGMTMAEVEVFYLEDFAALDPNSDGRIDETEFLNMEDIRDLRAQLPPGDEHAAVFRMYARGLHDQLDADRDGYISLQEYLDVSLPFARGIDADGDEFLSYEEVNADWERRQQLAGKWSAFTGGLNQQAGDKEHTSTAPDAGFGKLEDIGAIFGGTGR